MKNESALQQGQQLSCITSPIYSSDGDMVHYWVGRSNVVEIEVGRLAGPMV